MVSFADSLQTESRLVLILDRVHGIVRAARPFPRPASLHPLGGAAAQQRGQGDPRAYRRLGEGTGRTRAPGSARGAGPGWGAPGLAGLLERRPKTRGPARISTERRRQCRSPCPSGWPSQGHSWSFSTARNFARLRAPVLRRSRLPHVLLLARHCAVLRDGGEVATHFASCA